MPNNFTYNLNLPNGSATPAVNRPGMTTNTNSISQLINIDHVGFNTMGSGIHLQARMNNQAAPGLGDGTGVYYTNNPLSPTGPSFPIYQNINGSYQIIGGNTNADA